MLVSISSYAIGSWTMPKPGAFNRKKISLPPAQPERVSPRYGAQFVYLAYLGQIVWTMAALSRKDYNNDIR